MDDNVVVWVHVDHVVQILAKPDKLVIFFLGLDVLILDLRQFDEIKWRGLMNEIKMGVHGGEIEVVDLAVDDDFVVDHFVLEIVDSYMLVFVERSDILVWFRDGDFENGAFDYFLKKWIPNFP